MITEHILECRWESQRCICEELRACEQRISKEALQDAKARESNGITWAQAYSAALDAAREAVNALASTTVEFHGPLPVVHNVRITDALATIDALREEHK